MNKRQQRSNRKDFEGMARIENKKSKVKEDMK